MEWNNFDDVPDVLNSAQSRFSADVLVYNTKSKEHSIGYFDFIEHRWLFLSNENITNFVWRYFDKETDVPTRKKKKINEKRN